ncbi:MAG: MFS transporter, partial [Pyrinomonadaceae bacterium]
APPIIVLLATRTSWQMTFVITGALGFLWLGLWLLFYQTPDRHKWLTEEERRLIREGQSAEPGTTAEQNSTATASVEDVGAQIVYPAAPERAPRWAELLKYKQVWAIVLARFLTDPVWWLYITWLPLFLNRVHGYDLKQIGYFAWVPFVAADAGSLLGGWMSGHLIKRGWPVDRARKAVILFAALLMPAGILAAYAANPLTALALIGVVLFGFQIWINNVQTLPSDFFPDRAVASVAGLGGAGAGVGAMLFTLLTGRVVDAFGYTPILVTAGLLAPVGTLVLFTLAGPIKRIALSPSNVTGPSVH